MSKILGKGESFVLCGPSNCGKSDFIFKLLINWPELSHHPLDLIIYCYKTWSPNFDVLSDYFGVGKIFFFRNIPLHLVDKLLDCTRSCHRMLIWDDLEQEVLRNDYGDYFLNNRHRNLTLALITHNLYFDRKMRTISLNMQYLVQFRNPRNVQSLQHLAMEMFGKDAWRRLIKIYKKATKDKPCSYIVLDFRQSTPTSKRIILDLFRRPHPLYADLDDYGDDEEETTSKKAHSKGQENTQAAQEVERRHSER